MMFQSPSAVGLRIPSDPAAIGVQVPIPERPTPPPGRTGASCAAESDLLHYM